MKKLLIPMLGLTVFTVAGCSLLGGGKKQIDRFAFQEIVDKMDRPQFTTITAKYEFKYANHEDYNFVSNEKYEFLVGDGWYVSPSSEGTYCADFVGFSLYGTEFKFDNYSNIKYYKNPLSLEYDVLWSDYEEHYNYEFDKKYGVIKKLEIKGFYYAAPKDTLTYSFTFSYK